MKEEVEPCECRGGTVRYLIEYWTALDSRGIPIVLGRVGNILVRR
jgi:hypothetical protein